MQYCAQIFLVDKLELMWSHRIVCSLPFLAAVDLNAHRPVAARGTTAAEAIAGRPLVDLHADTATSVVRAAVAFVVPPIPRTSVCFSEADTPARLLRLARHVPVGVEWVKRCGNGDSSIQLTSSPSGCDPNHCRKPCQSCSGEIRLATTRYQSSSRPRCPCCDCRRVYDLAERTPVQESVHV